MKKRILSVVIAGLLVIGSATMPAYATPNQENIKQDYLDASKKIDDLNGKIYELNGKIEPLVVKIDENKRQIKDIQDEIENTKKEIETSKAAIAAQEEVLGGRVKELYKSGGQTSYLSILFSASNFSDLISKMEFTGRLINLDKKVVTELTTQQEKLNQKIEELDTKNKEIVKINDETQKSLAEFEKMKSEQQVLVDQAKVEFAKIDAQLYDAEIAEVQSYFDIINSSSSISEISSAVDSLTNALAETLSPSAQSEISQYIADGKREVEVLTQQQQPNRGGEVPSNPSSSGIVGYAYNFLGTPYVWGGTTPAGFDCSGFTSYVYRNAAGVGIGRDTYAQMGAGVAVSQSQLQPGDLVFTYGGGHVGIYVGGGSYIHASQPGDVVKLSHIQSFYTARRVL